MRGDGGRVRDDGIQHEHVCLGWIIHKTECPRGGDSQCGVYAAGLVAGVIDAHGVASCSRRDESEKEDEG